jgi:cephalosporin hydroxylase
MTQGTKNTQALPVVHPGYSQQETTELARQWTKAMWNSSLWKQVHWLGVPVLQWPTDLIVMQELIAKLRPNCIVETGLYLGGTAVFYASILELLGIDGRVISIDIQIHPEARRNIEASQYRKRIHLIEGDSKSDAVHQELGKLLNGEKNVMVCLDSDHSYAHTLGELRAFSRYVPVGGYLILFDTICRELADTPNGDPAWLNDSPMTALEEFLSENRNFVSDPEWEKLLVTFAPKGFLLRKS